MSAAKFSLGQCAITPGAQRAFEEVGADPTSVLYLHRSGDWGDLDAEDKQANEDALTEGTRIFSAYHIPLFAQHLPDRTKVYVITEADRSSTTILLPEEY